MGSELSRKRKMEYLNKLYVLAFDNISSELIELSGMDVNMIFKPEENDLIRKYMIIRLSKNRIKKAHSENPKWIECLDLYKRLSLVQRTLSDVLKYEFDVITTLELDSIKEKRETQENQRAN